MAENMFPMTRARHAAKLTKDERTIVAQRATIDALVAALLAVSPLVHKLDARRGQIDAALALARGEG